MRRHLPFLSLVALFALPVSCTEHKVIVNPAPEPAPAAPADETKADEPTPPEKPASNPLVVDLGDVQTNVDVPLEVPEGALGFNITVESKIEDFDQEAPFGIERITDPKGKVVHDNFMPQGGSKPTSTAAFDTIATVSVPQSEAVPESLTGTWKIRFGVANNPTKKLALKAKVRIQSSGDGIFHGGKLDLHIHVPAGLRVDGSEITDPSKAKSDPGLAERVDLFFQLTSQLLGFDRGEVVFHSAKASLADLDGVQALLDGFSVSAGTADGTQALHVLFTNSISDQGQPIAAGISPGIPGAATIFGRNVSGIIVTTMADAQTDTLTMIHEAGHFFGLNHTTEIAGTSDPLTDTPECPAEDLENHQFQQCPDRANVMFVAGAIDGPVTLSPTQKRIYRGSPIYKAFPAGTQRKKSAASNDSMLTVPLALKRSFRTSGLALSSPVEHDLASGFCGLTTLDAQGLVQRHGRSNAITQLRAASVDQDLAPYIRGRANLALKALGVQP